MYNLLKTKSIYTPQIQEIQNYDAFRRPPDFSFARRHARACRFANAQSENVDLCPCCGMPIQNYQLPICCNKSDINFNGAGITLYYEFIQFTIILLVVLEIISGLYNLFHNANGELCEQSQTCSFNYTNKYSLVNRAKEQNTTLYILDLISTVILIGITIYYRKWMNYTAIELDNAVVSVSDYSIQVSNLPLDASIEEIKEFFSVIEKQGEIKRLEIECICLGYDIHEYTQLINKKLEKEILISNYIAQEQQGKLKDSKKKEVLEEEVLELSRSIEMLQENFEDKFQFCGVAFITFNNSQQAHDCRNFHNQTLVQLMFSKVYYCFKKRKQLTSFKGKIPYVVRAPEPGDVIWQNLGENPWKQFGNKVLTNFATFIILCACFGIILLISIGQNKLNQSSQSKFHYSVYYMIALLGLLASLTISIINLLMAFTIQKLVVYEKRMTQTDYNISYARKLGYSQFINTALISLLVNVALQEGDVLESFWKRGGLNSDVSFILLINGTFPWLIRLFDPLYLWKLIKQWQLKRGGYHEAITQMEANLLFEGIQGDLSSQYAAVVKSLMLTLFYAQLLPIGIPIAIFSLIINYWVEKWLLLRRQARGPPIGKQLAQEMVDSYIEVALLLFAGGNCLWQWVLIGEIHFLVWAQLALSAFQYLIPLDWIFYWFIKVEGVLTSQTYKETKKQLWDVSVTQFQDYLKRNPVTQQKSIEEWIREQGDEQDEKVQGFLKQLQIKQQQDLTITRQNLMKQYNVPKNAFSVAVLNNKIQKPQIKIHPMEEPLLNERNQKYNNYSQVKLVESIILGQNQNKGPEIQFVESFIQVEQTTSQMHN